MDKKQRKALLREREESEKIASEKSRERRIGEDIQWRGCGQLAIQLRELPSFEPGLIWDIRDTPTGPLMLYVSRINPDKPGFLLPGYVELTCDESQLTSFVEQLDSVQVKTPLRFEGRIGLDGTSYSLIRSRGFDSVSFHWWEAGPPEWEALTSLVANFIDYLKQQPAAK